VKNLIFGVGVVVFVGLGALGPSFVRADDDFGEGEGISPEFMDPEWQDSEWVSDVVHQRSLERQSMYANDAGIDGDLTSGGSETGEVSGSDDELPLDPLPRSLDADGDGLSDGDEIRMGTNVNSSDSDGDGYMDGLEVFRGYNPLIKSPEDKIAWVEMVDYEKFLRSDEHLITDIRIESVGDKERLVVTGMGPANSVVVVFIFSDEAGVLIGRVDGTGRFRIESDTVLSAGDHRAYVAKVDAAGTLITGGPEVKFVRDERGVKIISSQKSGADEVNTKTLNSFSWGDYLYDKMVFILASVVVVAVGIMAYFVIKRRLAGGKNS
jgi:hypothetical protein